MDEIKWKVHNGTQWNVDEKFLGVIDHRSLFTIELDEMWMKKAWALSTKTFHLFVFIVELNEM
jgi:hypothetical protein